MKLNKMCFVKGCTDIPEISVMHEKALGKDDCCSVGLCDEHKDIAGKIKFNDEYPYYAYPLEKETIDD